MAGLAGAVVVLAGVSGVSRLADRPPTTRDARFDTPVFSRVDALIEGTGQIVVTLSDETYQLVRTTDGWAMDTAAGYPIRNDRLSTLAEGLKSLSWGGPRTRDPRKHDQIGVGDPEAGGNGALVHFLAEDGALLSALVTGRRDDKIYARRPDETTAYRVRGDLPPFYSRDAWMDFAVVEVAADTIAMAEIRDRFGDRVVLSRRAGAGPEAFSPAPPFVDLRLLTPLSATGPALALSRFAPIDAKPAASLTTAPVASLVTVTFDGLEIVASAYDEPEGGYIVLRAVEAGNASARAASINADAEGWAFKLTSQDYQDLTTPVSTIVVGDS
ncbi:MAG: DUF4340 domain-containing protein [Pseudomonadota bacterium]